MKKIKEFMYVFFFCVPFAIIIYTGCVIGILIVNLIKFMETKKINDIEVKEEPKNPNNQEVAERLYPGVDRQIDRMLFINGAKWQQEQDKNKYSEEDMKQFGDWCRNGLLNTEYGFEKLDEHLKQWKQFKNK
jgi:hypothetical protein